MRITTPILIILLLLIPSLAGADIIVGGDVSYSVVKGDSIELISARLGASSKALIRENGLNTKKPLPAGLEIRMNNRKIVPQTMENGIIVNVADRMLYFFRDGKLQRSFPVGLGIPSKKGVTRWRTPLRKFTIVGKRKDPTWNVPKSIQEEMAMEGKPVKTIVPPGPENPLGKYAMDTSIPGVLIHSTIWPTSVYKYRSHGCIRVSPESMEPFFPEVSVNTAGEIIYVPVKVAVTPEGRVLLEVNSDVYGKVKDMEAEVKRVIEERGLSGRVDWGKVVMVLKEKTGNAEDVTL
ncbi:MAG: L,D-transpeptidase family protein [Thermodesulfovibrionales bacterium]|jgi:L,D-transpeptidase ErfK/SrfK